MELDRGGARRRSSATRSLRYARRIPFGVKFVRLFDGVDISDPVAAAKDRAVFELRPVS